MELIRSHGDEEQRATIDDDVWWDYAPRSSLSSGSFSVDTQLADVVGAMPEDVRAAFDVEFPEWDDLVWSGSWIDCEVSGVDIEYSSWAIEWVEGHTNVTWEEGEPYITATDMFADQDSADMESVRLVES
jgi:hypothetical protein